MKAESTIRKQISRLKKVYGKSNNKMLKCAMDAECRALEWVISNSMKNWSPAPLAEALLISELKERKMGFSVVWKASTINNKKTKERE